MVPLIRFICITLFIINSVTIFSQNFVFNTGVDSLNPYEIEIRPSVYFNSTPGSLEIITIPNSTSSVNISKSALVIPQEVSIDTLTGRIVLPENDTSTYWFISFNPVDHKYAFRLDGVEIWYACYCGEKDRNSPYSCKATRYFENGHEFFDCINDGPECDTACYGEADIKYIIDNEEHELKTGYGGVIVKAPKVHYLYVMTISND